MCHLVSTARGWVKQGVVMGKDPPQNHMLSCCLEEWSGGTQWGGGLGLPFGACNKAARGGKGAQCLQKGWPQVYTQGGGVAARRAPPHPQ